MARIRHAYTQITPIVAAYFSTPTHDDLDAVTAVYGAGSDGLTGQFLYGLSTSGGKVGLIVSMVAGVLTTILAMIAGVVSGAAIWIGLGGSVITLVALFAYTAWAVTLERARIEPRFPTPASAADTAAEH